MHHKTITLVLTIVAVLLIIASFFVPPCGVVDSSVLAAVGEIFAFAALWTTIYSISRGADVTINHGQTQVTIDNKEEA